MANVHRLHNVDGSEEVVHLHSAPATVSSLGSARCALCGASLVGDPLHYHMVSPLVAMGSVTVCRTCHKAALSEGYRPAD
jgi:NAD-dependent SIR2 family protein deacetylase